jgi:NAD(P)-dependent dehydrogenase (short-subunit alcohol dehydrogenase family)
LTTQARASEVKSAENSSARARRGRRRGSPDDNATAVNFLSSGPASFIIGIDLLVDGGVVAATRWD